MNYFYDVTNGFNFFISEIYQGNSPTINSEYPGVGSYVIHIDGSNNRKLYKRVQTGGSSLSDDFQLIVDLSQLESAFSVSVENGDIIYQNNGAKVGLKLTRDGQTQVDVIGELINSKFPITGKSLFDSNNGTKKGEIFNDYSGNQANGEYSHAEGMSTTANGEYSHAEGTATTASGRSSHAEGNYTVASNSYSHTEGTATTASGFCSHAEGDNTIASGRRSHAEGFSTEASGDCSHAEGRSYKRFQKAKEDTNREINESDPYSILIDHMEFDSQPSGYNNVYSFAGGANSHVEGGNTIALTSAAHAEGYGSRACGPHSHAEGHGSVTMYCIENSGISESKSFANHAEGWRTQAGILVTDTTGAHAEGKSTNIYELVKKQNAPSSYDETDISYIMELWWNNHFTLSASIGAHAEGQDTLALGASSHAEGTNTKAVGNYSHAEGCETLAEGKYSHAEGYATEAGGNYTHASGLGTMAYYDCQFGVGKYNLDLDKAIFMVGNGSSSQNRKNAFAVYNDDTSEFAGTVFATEFSSGRGDYAEFFEWNDQNLNKEDRIGLMCKLIEEKIDFANQDDKIFGIIAAAPAIACDSAYSEWHNKYLKDIFGRIQYHDVLVPAEKDNDGNTIIEEHYEKQPILNPEYDPTREYISREYRPEWAPVGLLGKLVLIDDGTCVPGGYCKPSHDGIGTYSEEETNCYCMKRLDETHVKVMLK